MKKKGFTLVELLVVIAILAILATVSIVGYSSFTKKAKESNALTELTQIRDLMIAADIDDNVVYGTKATGTFDSKKTYYTKDGTTGKYTQVSNPSAEGFNNYYVDVKRTDLSDTNGLDSFEEAEALWNAIKNDVGTSLKGKLYYTEGKQLVYVLDEAYATLNPQKGEISTGTDSVDTLIANATLLNGTN